MEPFTAGEEDFQLHVLMHGTQSKNCAIHSLL